MMGRAGLYAKRRVTQSLAKAKSSSAFVNHSSTSLRSAMQDLPFPDNRCQERVTHNVSDLSTNSGDILRLPPSRDARCML